jgi:hypothetical protein
MLCPQCHSTNRRELLTEMMVHNGSIGTTPDLFTFPTASVCFECGYSTFTLEQNDLRELREACMNNSTKAVPASVTHASKRHKRVTPNCMPDLG